jgi:hypothetical protein
MGKAAEAEQREAANAALVAELTRRNPLRTLEQAEAWGRLRDAVESVRANVVDSDKELDAAYTAFVALREE